MIHITHTTVLDEGEIRERVVRAAASGKADVRKAAAAVELRLDIERDRKGALRVALQLLKL